MACKPLFGFVEQESTPHFANNHITTTRNECRRESALLRPQLRANSCWTCLGSIANRNVPTRSGLQERYPAEETKLKLQFFRRENNARVAATVASESMSWAYITRQTRVPRIRIWDLIFPSIQLMLGGYVVFPSPFFVFSSSISPYQLHTIRDSIFIALTAYSYRWPTISYMSSTLGVKKLARFDINPIREMASSRQSTCLYLNAALANVHAQSEALLL